MKSETVTSLSDLLSAGRSRPKFRKCLQHGIFALAVGGIVLAGGTAWAGTIVKENNTTSLDQGGSWVGGAAPGGQDVAVWDATVTAAQTLSLGSNLEWQGMSVLGTLGGNLTFSSGATLTLGAGGFSNASSKTITLNNAVTLGAAQTWSNTAGISIFAGGVATAGNTLTLNGAGTLQFKSAITGGGSLVINHNNLKFSSGTNASASAVTINSGGQLVFDSAVSAGGAARMASLTLNSGTLNVVAASNANEFDQITGALTVTGASKVAVTANASRYAQLSAASFVRNAGSAVLFAGSNLGVNTLASQTVGAANIQFAAAPALLGGGGAANTTTVSILPGAYGDTASNGSGFGATGGLVTYDANNGVRVLGASEYATAIVDGQTQLDNVKLSGVSGSPAAVSLTSANTKINSLSISVTGAGTNSGVTLGGDPGAKLTVASGVILASQSVTTPTASDITLISVPTLDLNGHEGIILASTNAQSGANGSYNAPLEIDSVITNDGGNGLTKAGSGSLKIGGSAQSAYTGDTVLNAGVLYLTKSSSNIAIPDNTTLIVNGGTLLQGNNQIPDNASVTVNGGAWAVSTSTSNGNSSSETIKNLTVTGGVAKNGQTRGGALSILGTATLSGGAFQAVGDGSNVTVSGLMSISNGATVALGASTTTGTNYNSRLTLNGGLAITNTASGAYIPISLSAAGTAGNNGGKLTLGGDVTFTGNAANSNTTTIAAPTGTGNSGIIALNGVRTFAVGDGAALSDLTIVPAMTDNGATVGALTKAGAGALELTGASSYTGATTVSAGTLIVSGSLNGTIAASVAAGAAFKVSGLLNTAAAIDVDGTLAGSGTVGLVNLHTGGVLSPGDGAGALTTGSESWAGGGVYLWEISALAGAGGAQGAASGWDYVSSAAGSLSIAADSAAKFTLKLDALGALPGWSNQADQSWTIASFGGGVTGFASDKFAVDAAAFADQNPLGQGYFQVVQSGNDLQLQFKAVPEPAAAVSLLLGACGLIGFRRPRRRAAN